MVKAVQKSDSNATFHPTVGKAAALRVGDKVEVKCIVVNNENNDQEGGIQKSEQWIPAHILACCSDGTFNVRFDSNYYEEVRVERNCIRPHKILQSASRHQSIDNDVPLHKRLQVTKLTQSSLYRRTDTRTSEQRVVDEHCTFKPVLKSENPFVSERTLRDIEMDREHAPNAASSLKNRKQTRKTKRSMPKTDVSITGGMYTSGFGFVSADAVPVDVPLFYFNPLRPPAFDSGTYVSPEIQVETHPQEPVVTTAIIEEEQDVIEDVEVQEEIQEEEIDEDSFKKIPVAPSLPRSAYEKVVQKEASRKHSLVIKKRDSIIQPVESGSGGMVDLMAELSEKLNKRGGSANMLKKAPKPEVGKLGMGGKRKKKKGKKGAADFKDVIDELSYTLAKLRGETLEAGEEEEEEEDEDTKPVAASDNADAPLAGDLNKHGQESKAASKPDPSTSSSSSTSSKPDKPVPPPVRPPPPPHGEPAVAAAQNIPLCPPLPNTWPPQESWIAPPLKMKRKLSINESDKKYRTITKQVATKKTVPVTKTSTVIPPPIVEKKTVHLTRILATGYYAPHPKPEEMEKVLETSDAGHSKSPTTHDDRRKEVLEVISSGVVTEAAAKQITDKLLEIKDEELRVFRSQRRNSVEEDDEEVHEIEEGDSCRSVTSTKTGVSSRSNRTNLLESKITVGDLPLPAGYHGAVQQLKRAKEVRSFAEHIEEKAKWRNYDDAERLSGMKMCVTNAVAPKSHVDKRNEKKLVGGDTHRKSNSASDVHNLPLSHHIPELPEGNHVATAATDLPGAHWATNLRKYDGKTDLNRTVIGKSDSMISDTTPPRSPYLRTGMETATNGKTYPATRTPGGVVRCYPESPRDSPKSPSFEHVNRVERQKLLKQERELREKKLKDDEHNRIQRYREHLKQNAMNEAIKNGVKVGNVIERRKQSINKLMREYNYRPELALSVQALQNAAVAEKDYYSNHPYAQLTTREEKLQKQQKRLQRRQKELLEKNQKNSTMSKLQNISETDGILDSFAVDAYYASENNGSNAAKKGAMSVNDLSYEYNKARGNYIQPSSSTRRNSVGKTVESGGGVVIIASEGDQDEGIAPRLYVPLSQRKTNRRASFR